MSVRIVQFVAIVVIALAVVPSGAHLAALPHKIGMPQDHYFVVQSAYRGWAWLGLLWLAGLTLGATSAVMVRSQAVPFWSAAGAAACFPIMLAVFLVWTQPANQATDNWTRTPENWTVLRLHWEYSHATSAVIVVLALCLIVYSALAWRPEG